MNFWNINWCCWSLCYRYWCFQMFKYLGDWGNTKFLICALTKIILIWIILKVWNIIFKLTLRFYPLRKVIHQIFRRVIGIAYLYVFSGIKVNTGPAKMAATLLKFKFISNISMKRFLKISFNFDSTSHSTYKYSRNLLIFNIIISSYFPKSKKKTIS